MILYLLGASRIDYEKQQDNKLMNIFQLVYKQPVQELYTEKGKVRNLL